jgi:hypothetical protein
MTVSVASLHLIWAGVAPDQVAIGLISDGGRYFISPILCPKSKLVGG